VRAGTCARQAMSARGMRMHVTDRTRSEMCTMAYLLTRSEGSASTRKFAPPPGPPVAQRWSRCRTGMQRNRTRPPRGRASCNAYGNELPEEVDTRLAGPTARTRLLPLHLVETSSALASGVLFKICQWSTRGPYAPRFSPGAGTSDERTVRPGAGRASSRPRITRPDSARSPPFPRSR